MLSRLMLGSALLTSVSGCQDEPLRARIVMAGAGGEAGAAVGGESGAPAGGESGSGGEAGEGPFVPPNWLSETGLFEDILSATIAAGVRPFTPQFELWSDGASKRRWLWLPEGTQIDTSDMDYWRYPVGTKVWKEFSSRNLLSGDGGFGLDRRVETRLLQKLSDGTWFMMAFRWNAEYSDAIAVPQGEENARGRDHDVPSTLDCVTCHEKMPDVLLGVTAIQLAHGGEGVTLDNLIAEGRLSDPPAEPLKVPGTAAERAALGYLHANCGLCHQPESVVSGEVDLNLWLRADDLESIETTPTYLTTVDVTPMRDDFPEATARIEPGSPAQSAIFLRMSSRDGVTQMPPLATDRVDPDGLATIQAWIEALGSP